MLRSTHPMLTADCPRHCQNGEPGIVNLELSRRFGRIADGENAEMILIVEGTNLCGEIFGQWRTLQSV